MDVSIMVQALLASTHTAKHQNLASFAAWQTCGCHRALRSGDVVCGVPPVGGTRAAL